MAGETITITTQDGDFTAYVARPSKPKAPAIVVVGAVGGLRQDLDWYVGALRENGLG